MPTATQVGRLEADVAAHRATAAFGIASTLSGESGLEPKRAWRGPVRAMVNWMMAEGLDRYRSVGLPQPTSKNSVAAISEQGFRAYVDPLIGEPLGGDDFSWTAAICLLMSDAPAQATRRPGPEPMTTT